MRLAFLCPLPPPTISPSLFSVTHNFNEIILSVIPAIRPIIKDKLDFTFAQIGLITHTLYMATLIEDVS